MVLYASLHSILASNACKKAVARWLGQDAVRRFYRLSYVILACLFLLPVPLLLAFLPDQPIYRLSAPWTFLSLGIQALAAIGVFLAASQTGALTFLGIHQALDVLPPTENSPSAERLVVSGLYAWVRHPIYSFSFILLWFSPLMTWNTLALSLGLSIYMLLAARFLEEPRLVAQFGQAYEAYRQRTPMIFPRLPFSRH